MDNVFVIIEISRLDESTVIIGVCTTLVNAINRIDKVCDEYDEYTHYVIREYELDGNLVQKYNSKGGSIG